MKDIFKNEKYMPVLGLICAFGWSLAYPFIKIGYAEFGISDIPGKIFFAGIRFLLADCWWLFLLRAGLILIREVIIAG